MRWKVILALCWNTWLFLSFQITQTVTNHIILKYKWVKLGMPVILVNWIKWCPSSPGWTEKIPSHFHTWDHSSFEILHWRKRCWVVSVIPQPATQVVSVVGKTPRCAKLSLVGTLFRRRRHTNIDTFEGTCQCQTSSTRFLSTMSPELVIYQ